MDINIQTVDNEQYFFGKKVIAFLDILGFSDLVSNNDHATLLNLYKSLVESPVKTHNLLAENQKRIQNERFRGEVPFSGLRIVNISDSLILWIDNSKETSLLDLFSSVRTLMTVAIGMGIPLRGAITIGDFDVLENSGNISIVGKALVNAYKIEKSQEWSGCIIDDEVFSRLREYEFIMKENGLIPVVERNPHLIIKYNIPYKNEVKEGYAINWPMFDTLSEELIRKSFGITSNRLKLIKKG